MMMEINEPGDRRFTLTGAGLSPEALTVIEVEATEQISRPYSLSITAVSDRDDLEIMDREVMVITDDRISHEPVARSVLFRSTAGDGRPDNTIHTLVMQQPRLSASSWLKITKFWRVANALIA